MSLRVILHLAMKLTETKIEFFFTDLNRQNLLSFNIRSLPTTL